VEEALNHFIDILEPEDEILVLAFNRQVRLLQDFTSDRDLLGDALSTVQTYGGTALYAAAYQAIERVARAPVESRAVVLVSDGVNTEAGVTFDELLALAQWSGVPVFSIGLDGRDRAKSSPDDERSRGGRRGDPGGGGKPGNGGSGNFGGPRRRPPGHGPGGGGQPSPKPQRFDQKVLEKLANETGGRAEVISGPERYTPGEGLSGGGRLRLAVELIALTLRHRYLLGYEPSEERTGWRTIRVEVDRPEGATAKAGKGYLVER
jgi:VWFA-related protein